MKIVTWNVNSVRTRLARLLALLERHAPDVVCLQETKVVDDTFPRADIEALGYRCYVFGQKSYNGVAILSRTEAEDVRRGFPGDPTADHARVISAKVDGVTVMSVYVVNGKRAGAPEYELKLSWLSALGAYLRATYDPTDSLVVAGDYNVAPADIDVHDPLLWKGSVLCSEPERQRLATLTDWGLADLMRLQTPDQLFSWWDYRDGGFRRNKGLRIDLILGTSPIVARLTGYEIDREERKETSGEGKPSDHAPVIAILD